MMRTSWLRAAMIGWLVLFGASAAQALPILTYSLDVEITHGTKFGVSAGDVLLDAGLMQIDQAGVSGVGTEYASITDFSLRLGSELWGWFPPPTISSVPGYGSYPTLNRATFNDGVLSEIELASVSQNGVLLELGGSVSNGVLGSLSLLADNYYVGEVLGRYQVNAIPEPSAALVFAIGGVLVAGRLRRR